MKTMIMAIIFLAASTAFAAEWRSYASNELVEAYFDTDSKLAHTVTVKWLYKKKIGSEKMYAIYRFNAYCTTRQLFSISEDNSEHEVKLEPGTLYEATWQMICGLQ
jgi:hypothetical protein